MHLHVEYSLCIFKNQIVYLVSFGRNKAYENKDNVFIIQTLRLFLNSKFQIETFNSTKHTKHIDIERGLTVEETNFILNEDVQSTSKVQE